MINANDRKDTMNPKILIVEDSPTQAVELQYILEKEGYSLLLAQNGMEALVLIGQSKPAIVISDIIMPKMDGYELCRRIKEDQSSKDILVMLLTSLSEPQDVIKSLECGADKFFTKPYNEEHLLLTVKNLLSTDDLFAVRENNEQVEVRYGGRSYTITSGRSEIINLLISTYEAAVIKNSQLIKTQDELEELNKDLEAIVAKRTADLETKNEELKLMLQQLWQASKLATMGELAASIAHELNNPMATVDLRIEALLAQIPPEDPKRRSLEVIEQEVDRMATLVANLLSFSRRSQAEFSTVDICKEIDSTLELVFYHLRKYGISVQQEISPDIPLIHADRQQLRQLFLNLFTNSSDAMPQGGSLTIRVYVQGSGVGEQGSGFGGQGAESGVLESGDTRSADPRSPIPDPCPSDPRSPIPDPCSSIPGPLFPIPDPRPLIPASQGAGFVVIEIADTGLGISPEALSKVTEPFFTTKPEGKGTGLGLPICRRIVQEHNGLFEIFSEGLPGRGTTIRISLPVKNGMNAKNLKKDL